MFLLHGSIAKLTVVQLQHLFNYKDMDRLNDWFERKNRGAHLLPSKSDFGGDISLLPDVVALFLPPEFLMQYVNNKRAGPVAFNVFLLQTMS